MPGPKRHRRGSDSPLPKPESQLQAIMRSTCSQITLLPVFEDAALLLTNTTTGKRIQKDSSFQFARPGRNTQTGSFWSQDAVFVSENNVKQYTSELLKDFTRSSSVR